MKKINDIDDIAYGIVGLSGLVTGGAALGLSKTDKFKDNKALNIIGAIALGIGLIFAALFGDSNLYPEEEIEDDVL